jgi:hypothetical protein
MIVFRRQHIIRLGFDDPPGDGFLAAHCINRDPRTGQIEQRQQVRKGRDFIRFIRHRPLRQDQARLRRIDAHQVHRAVALATAPRRFPAQARLLARKTRQCRLDPLQKGLRKGFRPNPPEHITQRIV